MVFFAIVNLALLAWSGVRFGGDTPLYLDGANRVLDGRPLIDREPSYPGYVLLVAAAQAIGVGPFGIVMAQLALGAVAAAAVYAMGTAMAGRFAGALAAVLYSVDVDTNRWHQFILTDSVYLSLFTIAVWLTYRAATRPGAEPLLSAGATLIAAALVRPEGWFTIPAAAVYVIVMRARSTAQRVAGGGALVAAAVGFVLIVAPIFRGNLQAVGPAEMLQRGQTIWEYDGWRVAMPPNDVPATGQGAAIGYALRHPVSTITLMGARVAVHFAHLLPFYSAAHNVAIVAWLVPVYAATLLAIWKLGLTPLVSWILVAIGTQTLVVALTHAEWDGRYLAHVLPLIYTLTGAGVAVLIGKSVPASGAAAHA
jgi:hypothetical protein